MPGSVAGAHSSEGVAGRQERRLRAVRAMEKEIEEGKGGGGLGVADEATWGEARKGSGETLSFIIRLLSLHPNKTELFSLLPPPHKAEKPSDATSALEKGAWGRAWATKQKATSDRALRQIRTTWPQTHVFLCGLSVTSLLTVTKSKLFSHSSPSLRRDNFSLA